MGSPYVDPSGPTSHRWNLWIKLADDPRCPTLPDSPGERRQGRLVRHGVPTGAPGRRGRAPDGEGHGTQSDEVQDDRDVDYVQAQRHKGFEKVQVTFDDQPDDQAHRGRRNRDGAV